MSSEITSLPTSINLRPELTRPPVPEKLMNKLNLSEASESKDKPIAPKLPHENKVTQADDNKQSIQNNRPKPQSPLNLGGASAVAVQAQQSIPVNENTEPDAEESANLNELTEEEKALVKELKARDEEVRRHENAHKAAGGSYTGAIEYEYTRGPDGNRYAVGGKVSIDTSPVSGDPEATIEKMRIIQAAALAPASPSGADKAVAAKAAQLTREAEADLREEKTEEKEGLTDNSEDNKQPNANEATIDDPQDNTISRSEQLQGNVIDGKSQNDERILSPAAVIQQSISEPNQNINLDILV